ncbi:MAG: hypothetical protein NC548_43020 [Lachnospiraceae bacterium]|nr:hypothetical protein [Lachnospiraceae bacterium]MCM1231481.1 hypothetical protein [Ruminococcus flavefaciens]
MTNKVKKVLAGIITTASLATGMVGMSAGAYWANRTYNDNLSTVTGYLSVATSELYASTSSDNSTYKTVEIYNYDNYGNSVRNYGTAKKISKSTSGGSYTKASASSSSNGYYMSPALTVWA